MTRRIFRERIAPVLLGVFLVLFFFPDSTGAVALPTITLGVDEAESPKQISNALQVLFILTVFSVAPAILLMTTCFTRIVIVLGGLLHGMPPRWPIHCLKYYRLNAMILWKILLTVGVRRSRL